MIEITVCPPCGGSRIRPVQRDWTSEFEGQAYSVPSLHFNECPDCGERVYDRDAMRRIEACSPAYAKRRQKKEAVGAGT
jgi:YgiT-type zinc finger domain-containing protein